MKDHNCIVVLGATASGKTRLACRLAYHLGGEIISADSRQVYKQLDIGTGKDLDEYQMNGQLIPYHLINIVEPGEQFYLHQFIEQLEETFNNIRQRNKLPIICGGTGLYLDALRKDFSFTQIKENEILRAKLENLSKEELLKKLLDYPEELTTHVDTNSKKRIIRGIEIADYRAKNKLTDNKKKLPYQPLYIGIDISTEERKRRISERLKQRLNSGLVEEAETLIKNGISYQRLETLGLEYKFLSYFLQQKISKEELFTQLQTAIFQFSKRQLTWFRKMEKEGVKINWIKADCTIEEITSWIEKNYNLI